MHDTADLSIIVNETDVIPVNLDSVIGFVRQLKVELFQGNVPDDVNEIVFIAVLAYLTLFEGNNLCFAKLLLGICRAFYSRKLNVVHRSVGL
jgi:hypothetical protein